MVRATLRMRSSARAEEGELLHRLLQQIAEPGINGAELLQLGRGHPGVGGDLAAAEARSLPLAGLLDTRADVGGGLNGLVVAQFFATGAICVPAE
jgi:hypothetical protein